MIAPAAPAPSAPPRRPGFGVGHLVAAVAAALFLGGAVTYTALARMDQPSDAEVAFLQDMIAHHENAVVTSLLVDGEQVPPAVEHFAEEVVIFQQYEIGLMEAALRRWGEPRSTGGESMEWMGEGHATEEMPGMVSDEQLEALRDAEGDEAAALWLAMMSRHHLAGVEMAEAGAAVATDDHVAELAERMAGNQAQEIAEYAALRDRLGLPVPEGYTDPPSLDEDHAGHEG